MTALRWPKFTSAGAVGEIQLIEQFGRPLGVDSIEGLRLKQHANRHLLITSPNVKRAGKVDVWLDGCEDLLLTSRQPLLDTARFLLAIGCKPNSMIAARRVASANDDIRGRLHIAASLTVDEANGTVFARWRPFCLSSISGRSRLASPADGRVACFTRTDQRPNRREAIHERLSDTKSTKPEQHNG